jgi:hypothetical protein
MAEDNALVIVAGYQDLDSARHDFDTLTERATTKASRCRVRSFDDGAAEERHTVQYFEMFGSRAIYKDGWWACARTRSPS